MTAGPMPDPTEDEKVSAFIRDLVEQQWVTEQRPVLLARLGVILRKEYPEFVAALQIGLRRYIETSHVARVVVHPTLEQKIGIIPLNAQLPDDVAAIFGVGNRPKRPHLIRAFWEAFHEQIQERRFVVVGGDIPIRVIEAPADPPETVAAYEILRTDLVFPMPAPILERINATWEKIDAWVKRNGLDIRLFEDRRELLPKQQSNASTQITPGIAPDRIIDWTHALDALDPHDQARIFIPLDIVKKLLSRK